MNAQTKHAPATAVRTHLQPWIERATALKDLWVRWDERGDLPPALWAVRDGRVIALAVARQVNKYLGVRAAHYLWDTLKPTELVTVMDAHMAEAPAGTDRAAFEKQWPAGSMQRACDEEDACARGLITDCLVVTAYAPAGQMMIASMPYSYHGRGGPPLRWQESVQVAEDDHGGNIGGYLPDALAEAARAPGAGRAEIMRKLGTPDRGDLAASFDQAARLALALRGYHVFATALPPAGWHPGPPTPRERAQRRRRVQRARS